MKVVIKEFPLIPDEVLDYLAWEYSKLDKKTLTFESYAKIRFFEDTLKVFSKSS